MSSKKKDEFMKEAMQLLEQFVGDEPKGQKETANESSSVEFMYDERRFASKGTTDRLEDEIPDLPGNEEAREFLAKAPKKGLYMPLGKEVKVMQCWRCKRYGHRAGDKECPMTQSGNVRIEAERRTREDPLYAQLHMQKDETKLKEKEQKKEMIQQLLTLAKAEEEKRKEKKRKRKEERKKRKKKKKKTRRRKEKNSATEESSTRSSDSSSSSSSGSSSGSSRENRKKSKKRKRDETDSSSSWSEVSEDKRKQKKKRSSKRSDY